MIPIRQFGDKLVALRRFRRCDYLFLTGRRVAHTDIIQDALLEQENILEHKADMAHQVILRHIAHIYAADGNAAGRYIPKPRNQIGNRTFAAAGRADNSRNLSLLRNKGNILQRLFVYVSRVGKADILESNIIIGGFLGMARFRHFRDVQNFIHPSHIPINLHERLGDIHDLIQYAGNCRYKEQIENEGHGKPGKII